jgi:hypothetical protein
MHTWARVFLESLIPHLVNLALSHTSVEYTTYNVLPHMFPKELLVKV